MWLISRAYRFQQWHTTNSSHESRLRIVRPVSRQNGPQASSNPSLLELGTTWMKRRVQGRQMLRCEGPSDCKKSIPKGPKPKRKQRAKLVWQGQQAGQNAKINHCIESIYDHANKSHVALQQERKMAAGKSKPSHQWNNNKSSSWKEAKTIFQTTKTGTPKWAASIAINKT